jgi:hypothetical protein
VLGGGGLGFSSTRTGVFSLLGLRFDLGYGSIDQCAWAADAQTWFMFNEPVTCELFRSTLILLRSPMFFLRAHRSWSSYHNNEMQLWRHWRVIFFPNKLQCKFISISILHLFFYFYTLHLVEKSRRSLKLLSSEGFNFFYHIHFHYCVVFFFTTCIFWIDWQETSQMLLWSC